MHVAVSPALLAWPSASNVEFTGSADGRFLWRESDVPRVTSTRTAALLRSEVLVESVLAELVVLAPLRRIAQNGPQLAYRLEACRGFIAPAVLVRVDDRPYTPLSAHDFCVCSIAFDAEQRVEQPHSQECPAEN